ncbi:hypothetical protein HP532_19225 [Pseudomonas sp. CrR25]|nr:hypothetical protein [Pseudomonas sp. CrR25]
MVVEANENNSGKGTVVDPMLVENYAPVLEEIEIGGLKASFGKIPEGLKGTLYRNGPNAMFPPIGGKHSWYFGEGMVHALTINGGEVRYIIGLA